MLRTEQRAPLGLTWLGEPVEQPALDVPAVRDEPVSLALLARLG